MEVNIRKHLSEFGLKQEEIDKLATKDAIQYIRFCHRKEWGNSLISFLGFSEEEVKILSDKAKNCNLIVKNRLSSNLSFICVSENASPKRVEKTKEYSGTLLTKNEFIKIFDGSRFDLLDNDLLYEQSLSKEFRITKPLSNFDQTIEVESFSFENETTYSVNLYQMTCTCKDFEKKQRNKYLKGDIRRMCKHLMDQYKNNFGLIGLSDLNRYIIENGYPLNKHSSYFRIEEIPLAVMVNYETKNGWWNIFMPNEDGVYSRYGYSSTEKRFSNNEKPHGLVQILRKNLDELAIRLNENSGNYGNSNIGNGEEKNIIPQGCIYLAIVIVLIFVFLLCKIF